MMKTTQLKLLLIFFISIVYNIEARIFAQSYNSQKNKFEHTVHPKIELPNSIKNTKSKSKYLTKLKSSFKTVKWLDLMPKKDFDSLSNPPDYLISTDEGSKGDEILDELRNLPKSIQDDYQRALTSTEVIADMDNKAIRIPGFVVPLEFNNEKKINQFFLVPYFGACIHLPPPPPNQIIFVTSKTGLEIKELLDPVWISGILRTSHFENDVALSAYSMQMQSFEKYEE